MIAQDGSCEVEIRHAGALPPGLLDALARLAERPHADGPGIARLLVERGVPLLGLNARRPSLEDQFLEIMGDDGRPG